MHTIGFSPEPELLISVYVNENNEIEDSKLLDCFIIGWLGDEIRNDSGYYDKYALDSAGLFEHCSECDTLYHVYLKISFNTVNDYYEGESTETILQILQVLKVKTNYRDFLEKNEHHQEQLKLIEKDVNLGSMSISNEFLNNSSLNLEINYHDYKNILDMVAQNDIYLAHRMASNDELQLQLGNIYNEKIREVEKQKISFKNFLRWNVQHDIVFNEKGYYVQKKPLRVFNSFELPIKKQTVFISYEDIDGLEDDILLELNNEQLLAHFYSQNEILKVFEEKKEEEN